MALELLISEARDLSEDSIMEVVQYIRAIKFKSRHAENDVPLSEQPVIREAGMYRGQVFLSDDFNEPLEDFKEYM